MWAILRGICVLGVLLTETLIYVVLQHPKVFEKSALGFVQSQIKTELQERHPDQASGLKAVAGHLAQTQQRLGDGDALGSKLPELIAMIAALQCSCPGARDDTARRTADAIREALANQIQHLNSGQKRLSDLIRKKYDRTLSELRTDVLIFLSTNLAAFSLLLAASFLPMRRHTVLPGSLLLVAVAASVWMYLAEQNWFYTILFGSYYGYGYATMMLIIFGLLVDVIMFRAWISRKLLQVLPGGGAPC